VGLFLTLAGVWLLAAGLVGAGMPRWLAVTLAMAGTVAVAPLYSALQLESTTGGGGVAVFAAIALVVSAVALLALRRGHTLTRALALGLGSAVVAIACYALVGLVTGAPLNVYLQLGVDASLAHKPPVLEGFGLLACVLAGVAVYLFARRVSGEQPATNTPAVQS
jgi:hypothetical protein